MQLFLKSETVEIKKKKIVLNPWSGRVSDPQEAPCGCVWGVGPPGLKSSPRLGLKALFIPPSLALTQPSPVDPVHTPQARTTRRTHRRPFPPCRDTCLWPPFPLPPLPTHILTMTLPTPWLLSLTLPSAGSMLGSISPSAPPRNLDSSYLPPATSFSSSLLSPLGF